jgi:hypothetical protein
MQFPLWSRGTNRCRFQRSDISRGRMILYGMASCCRTQANTESTSLKSARQLCVNVCHMLGYKNDLIKSLGQLYTQTWPQLIAGLGLRETVMKYEIFVHIVSFVHMHGWSSRFALHELVIYGSQSNRRP